MSRLNLRTVVEDDGICGEALVSLEKVFNYEQRSASP